MSAAENYVAAITCKNTTGVREKLVADRLSRGLYHTDNKRESKRDRRK